ncbi:catalase family peroxidase [Methylobacterium sp. CM6247]
MTDDTDPARHPPVSRRSLVEAFALIGAIAGAAAATFAFVAGWFSPGRLTADGIVATFEAVNGPHPGFRRNHAKGLCATGRFESTGEAGGLSRAAVLTQGPSRVEARFALAGGMPFQVDGPKAVRSLALRLLPADGAEEWRMGLIDIPVFNVTNAQGFRDALAASTPGADGKPDPEAMKAFLSMHPETVAALKIIGRRAISSGFANDTYNSINAFHFVARDGISTPVRWSLMPVQSFAAPMPGHGDGNPNYLFDDVAKAIGIHPLQWRLSVTVGQAGDRTDDPTLPWPLDRRTVQAGLLTIDTVRSEDDGACTAVLFDPLILPDGIAPSDDPILSARSSAYAKSFTLRAGETKPPSAVTVEAVRALKKVGQP